MEPLAYDISTAGKVIGVGRTKIYAAIAAGDLASVKLGARWLVTRDALQQFLRLLSERADREATGSAP
ncbi:MAG: helix-turn-helix domain-containing protein [Solirubrobacteraceae bacterium]